MIGPSVVKSDARTSRCPVKTCCGELFTEW